MVSRDPAFLEGAIGEDGQVPYLLAAATHEEPVVLAERLIGVKYLDQAVCRRGFHYSAV